MVANPSRRAEETPGPAQGPTPFADAALELHSYDLAPIPLGGDDGKVPLVKWSRWGSRPGRQFLERLTTKFSTKNVGILTGLSGVTVVDIDEPKLIDDMVARCGDTPLKVGTPSGGLHLYYLANGERCRNLRGEGLAVDIKGVGGMVVVPPSVRLSGDHADKPYTFLEGFWDDICHLPLLKPGSLHVGKANLDSRMSRLKLATESQATTTAENLRAVHDGARGDCLFRACLEQAPHCGNDDDLVDAARTINDSYVPPMADAKVIKAARSAWRYQIESRNWRGTGSHVTIDERTLDQILIYDKKHGPEALALYFKLRAKHGARDKRSETFAIAARAMAAKRVLPWTPRRIYRATEVLIGFGLLDRVKTGGHGKGDTHQYRFCSPRPA